MVHELDEYVKCLLCKNVNKVPKMNEMVDLDVSLEIILKVRF